jgi:formyl-CoA transferase
MDTKSDALLGIRVLDLSRVLAGPYCTMLLADMGARRIPACPIYDVRAASEDPHIAGAREMIVEMEHPRIGNARLLGNPIKMSETRPSPWGPAPSLGGNTVDILEGLLGITEKEVGRLRDEGIV